MELDEILTSEERSVLECISETIFLHSTSSWGWSDLTGHPNRPKEVSSRHWNSFRKW